METKELEVIARQRALIKDLKRLVKAQQEFIDILKETRDNQSEIIDMLLTAKRKEIFSVDAT